LISVKCEQGKLAELHESELRPIRYLSVQSIPESAEPAMLMKLPAATRFDGDHMGSPGFAWSVI